MIVTDLQPVSVVEDAGFCGSGIPKLHEQVKTTLKETTEFASSLSLTSDMWTARTTEASLTETGHLINRIGRLALLRQSMWFYSTQKTSSDLLRKISEDWGITSKVQAVITDNGANMFSPVWKTHWKHTLFCSHSQLSCEGLH